MTAMPPKKIKMTAMPPKLIPNDSHATLDIYITISRTITL